MPRIRSPFRTHEPRLNRRRSTFVAVVCALCWALVGFATIGPQRVDARERREVQADFGTMRVADLPFEGRRTLSEIQAGGPFVSRRDGVVFGNRERLLPRQPRGYYAEYTVPTPGARNRGARRIIAGRGGTGDFRSSGEYYYTDDHYQSFRRILQ